MALIKVEHIWKIYKLGDIDLEVLKDVSLQINTGEFVAIMGPSGSGKSTFMNMLGCLDKPTKGKYILDGQDITDSTLSKLADIRCRKIGFVFQGFNLLSRTTAMENVELPMIYAHTPTNQRYQKAKAALESVGLGERLYHMPNQLSGGQQQRVAIARAIVNDAPIIFADEPTAELDTLTALQVMKIFKELIVSQGITIVMTTHDLSILELADHVYPLEDGKVIDEPFPQKEAAL